MEYELKNMNLLAAGGQAEIYEIDDSKVLRVLRDQGDEELLKAEYNIINMLEKSGLDVPKVYEYVVADGRPALVVERIKGASMMGAMLKSPLKAAGFIKLLAKLHSDVLKVKAMEDLLDIKERAEFLIDKSSVLSEIEKRFVHSLIEQVPYGDYLCHGDFHPGNILISSEKFYIIDWFGATKGAPASDAAHTYLLLKSAPEVPGTSVIQRAVLKLSGKLLAGKYYKAIRREMQFTDEEFSIWLVIRAAERSYYGFDGEKQRRAKFVEKCSKNPKNISQWKKYI